MAFTLNIGKGDGAGSSGFGKKASAAIDKCKSMAPYMGTLQDNLTGGVDGGAGTPGGFSPSVSPNNMNTPGPNYSSMANQNDDDRGGNKRQTIDEGPSGMSSTNRREMTPKELLAKAVKLGVPTTVLKKRQAKEMARQTANVRNSKAPKTNSNQMGEILGAGPNESDKKKKADEMARSGKTPAKMMGKKY